MCGRTADDVWLPTGARTSASMIADSTLDAASDPMSYSTVKEHPVGDTSTSSPAAGQSIAALTDGAVYELVTMCQA